MKKNLELELEKYKGIWSDYEISEIDQNLFVKDMP